MHARACNFHAAPCKMRRDNLYACMYSQSPLGATVSNAVSKLKAQSSNVSFH